MLRRSCVDGAVMTISGATGIVAVEAAEAFGSAAARRASLQQQVSWRRTDAMLRRKASTNLVVLGDSLLAGMGCEEGSRRWKACAYPARLMDHLRNGCTHSVSTLSLLNRAVGGTTTAGVLPQLPLPLHERAW